MQHNEHLWAYIFWHAARDSRHEADLLRYAAAIF
jgi:hypothetical protein